MNTEPESWPPPPSSVPPGGPPKFSGSPSLILVLGILSLIGVLDFLGPLAWIMGNNALVSGTLDPAQTSQVNTGRICGMIGTGLLAVGLAGTVVLVGIFFIAALGH
jgi:hypothetical protein